MHVPISPMFQGQLIEKKIRTITYVVWVLERVEKNAKKRLKNIFFVQNKYQSVTHYIHFSRTFRNIVFRSVALVIKKLWAI